MVNTDKNNLPSYRCHKIVKATLIAAINGCTLHSADGKHEITVSPEYIERHPLNQKGYYVLYEDGYESFSPKDAFENGYTQIVIVEGTLLTGLMFTFDIALQMLKQGRRLARHGWNGKGMFVFREDKDLVVIGEDHPVFSAGQSFNVAASLWMKTATGELIPWLASQADILADDWMLAP